MTRHLILIIAILFILSSCRQDQYSDLGGYNQSKVDSAETDANSDIKKGDIHIIAYGTPDIFTNDITDSLAKCFGFYYKNGGCVIDVTSDAYSKIYNKVVTNYLTKQNGKDWLKRFENLSDSLVDAYYKR